MPTFKPGDPVQLKFGGPRMLVRRIIGTSTDMLVNMQDEILRRQGYNIGDVLCDWYEDNKLVSRAFAAEQLQEYNRDEDPTVLHASVW